MIILTKSGNHQKTMKDNKQILRPWMPGLVAASLAVASISNLCAQRVAIATADVSAGGAVTNLTVTDGGAGYAAAPGIVIGGGGGSNAIARASVVDGSVAAIQLLSGGSGYTNAPSVGIDPPDVPVSTLAMRLVPQITLAGELGSTQEVQVAAALDGSPSWVSLGTVVLTNSPWTWFDTNSTPTGQRYYRAVVRGYERPAIPPAMVWLPPGSFVMGSPLSDPDYHANEGPQTVIHLTQGFFLSRYEVSQREYTALMNTNPATFSGDISLPVETVAWSEAVAYCARLTQREQSAGRIPATWRYRLPTEAEWEYAAQVGGLAPSASRGAEVDDYAWLAATSQAKTHPVGLKQPNAWGIFDLAGNVREWCSDLLGDYPGGEVTDPQGAPAGQFRVARGGSWLDTAVAGRGPARAGFFGPPVEWRGGDVGFRIVLAPQYGKPEMPVSTEAAGGVISGRVTMRASGFPVPGVTVKLVNADFPLDTNNISANRPALVAETVTGLDGAYAFGSLKPGGYGLIPMKWDSDFLWDFQAASNPPTVRLASPNAAHTVDFISEESLFEANDKFRVTITVTNLTEGVDPKNIQITCQRRSRGWLSIFEYWHDHKITQDNINKRIYVMEPVYGSTMLLTTLENVFALKLYYKPDKSKVLKHDRELGFGLSDCPANSNWTWDWVTGDLKREL